jgi:hypothetical protein
MILKQVFEHYEKWEDYKAGMFTTSTIQNKEEKILLSVNLLSSEKDFYEASLRMINDWEICTNVNLTNKGQNRRAWIGAATCMHKHGAPEYITRIAWSLLDKEVQIKANLIADKLIHEFETKSSNVKTLFE